jgi:CRISPR-associated protein Cmr4
MHQPTVLVWFILQTFINKLISKLQKNDVMYKQASIYFLRCETPLHVGSGETHSYIDLPIQREKHTGFPKIEGSSLKGALREALESNSADDNIVNILLGKDKNADASASMGFTDARILLFPIKSYKGIMAWVTCPQVLFKFAKEFTLTKSGDKITINDLPATLEDDQIIAGPAVVHGESKVLLEEYTFDNLVSNVQVNESSLYKWLADHIFSKEDEKFWNTFMRERIAIVSNDVFRDLVEHYTSIATRNKINDDTGAAEDGALFTIEYLADESVLYHLATASDEFSKETVRLEAKDIMEYYEDNLPSVIQIGGNATIGKGIVNIIKL